MHSGTIKSDYYLARLVASLLMASCFLSGCATPGSTEDAANAEALVAITAAPTNVYHQGKFVWHDLITPDIAASRKFYSGLFDWTFLQQGRYTIILNKGHRIGGMLEVKPQTGKEAEAVWLAYMSVPDVDKASDYLEDHGGEIIKGPLDMPHRGRGALVSDPLGAHLLLLHAMDGDPADSVPVEGSWLWDELWSNQPQDSFIFYQNLGRYDSIFGQRDYQILENEGKWRAGIRHVPEDDFKVRWVSSIRVKDPALLLDKVTSLGGKIWVRPGESLKDTGANIAVISDNVGAFLILHRWKPGDKDLGSEGQ
ncbi:VOC family protein [Methyloprofundus sp.]|uniref:VOC family protein n=1 Tax=Methyloprofundus sp. TaxID=2020875 RepID=UPI003D0E00A0